jgi:ADP-dependent phosphofructokinase/glucokinase
MAKVKWAEGIEYVSGLLTKRPKAGSMHSDHCSALLATHRVAATENPVCTRLYMVGPYKRSTPLSSNELDARARFAAVAAAVKARKSDLNNITQDQINFAAQKDQAGGKKTMKAYLWKVCGDAYDQAHQG